MWGGRSGIFLPAGSESNPLPSSSSSPQPVSSFDGAAAADDTTPPTNRKRKFGSSDVSGAAVDPATKSPKSLKVERIETSPSQSDFIVEQAASLLPATPLTLGGFEDEENPAEPRPMDSDDDFNSGLSSDGDIGMDDSSVEFGAGTLTRLVTICDNWGTSNICQSHRVSVAKCALVCALSSLLIY